MGQSASFTPRTLTLGAMGTGVKQSNSGWNSKCDRQVRMPPSLIIGHYRPRATVRGAGRPFQHPTNVPIRIAQHSIDPAC